MLIVHRLSTCQPIYEASYMLRRSKHARPLQKLSTPDSSQRRTPSIGRKAAVTYLIVCEAEVVI